MRPTHLFALALSLAALACQSSPRVVQGDPAKRHSLFSAITSLEGRWKTTDPHAPPQYTEFEVTSAGSAVRETMMPGEESEMINMYSLDGDSLVLTHYCAGGNQPRMRATSVENGRMAFVADGVADLKSEDEVYMGSMTLVIKGPDQIEQRWRALKDGTLEDEMVIALTRVK